MKKLAILFVVMLLSVTVSNSAFAAKAPKLVSTHGDWSVYSFNDNGGDVCFMSSQPKSKKGNYKKRGEVFIFITRWSNNKDKNVVSISNGYTFKKGSTAVVSVDDKKYNLFTQNEMAWTKDQATDNALTDGIKRGSSLKVQGFSKYGTETNDRYSLKGTTKAYESLVKACK